MKDDEVALLDKASKIENRKRNNFCITHSISKAKEVIKNNKNRTT